MSLLAKKRKALEEKFSKLPCFIPCDADTMLYYRVCVDCAIRYRSQVTQDPPRQYDGFRVADYGHCAECELPFSVYPNG